ncbi:hypothetical protein [Anaerophaga thermohalophila]|uniref:hypothetical protein n=1 Tax=Anaerophaga thermohalophila TaxID=177400 RepID=UPI000237CC68|nr:hypothetical protein [Anaerophaga thermohalophila]
MLSRTIITNGAVIKLNPTDQIYTMIEIVKEEKLLLLKYYSDYGAPDWIDGRLESKKPFKIKGVFWVQESNFHEKVIEDFEDPEYYFVIGNLIGDYYQLDRSVFGWIKRSIPTQKTA